MSERKLLIDNRENDALIFDKKSAIFQDFSKYEMNVSDNITISHLENVTDADKVVSAINQAGLNNIVNNLPLGVDTMLGKEFNGIELSGGQWQRIAISRGLFKEHELIVLDEPTSAIDPIEERNLYEKFQEICRHKTSILITHRIGSAKLAERILVLREGAIIEEGSHQELMNIDGEYKRLYEEQSKWY